jgi:hypothetical protein
MWADLAPRPAVAGVAAVGAAVASVAVASVAVASRPLGRPARAWPVCHHAPRGAKAHAPRGAWWQTDHGGGMGCAHLLGLMGSPISPLYLPCISPISPLYLPCISPASPLYLPCISRCAHLLGLMGSVRRNCTACALAMEARSSSEGVPSTWRQI